VHDDVATHATFVATGCLRSYVIDGKGKEHIVQFAPEDWWLADNTSLMTGTPSQYFVDAVEDSTLLLGDPPSHQRIVSALSTSADERYQEFLRMYPSIASWSA
jgi:hypothetical protein